MDGIFEAMLQESLPELLDYKAAFKNKESWFWDSYDEDEDGTPEESISNFIALALEKKLKKKSALKKIMKYIETDEDKILEAFWNFVPNRIEKFIKDGWK